MAAQAPVGGPNPGMQQPYYPPPSYGGPNGPPPQGGPVGPPPYGAPMGPPPPGQVVVVQRQGGCPRCGVGAVVPQYTICGMIMAVLFFPIGILCCLCMKEMRCNNCGSVF